MFRKSVLTLLAVALILSMAPSLAGAATIPSCIPHLAPDGDGTVVNIAFYGDRNTLKEILLTQGWMVDDSPFHHGDGLALQKNVTWLDITIPVIDIQIAHAPVYRDHINLWEVTQGGHTYTYGNAHHDTWPAPADPASHYVTDYDNVRDLVVQDFHTRVTQLYGGALEVYLRNNNPGYYGCHDPAFFLFSIVPNPWYGKPIGGANTDGDLAFCFIGSGD